MNPEQHDIVKIKYFTARVKRESNDTSNIIKQNIYLRALKTISNLEIIFGQFKRRQVKGIVIHSHSNEYMRGSDIVTISKWEEKESDVNIATHLIEDGYEDQYECAVLISNDTDLKTPLLRVKRKLKKIVGVISPHKWVHIDLQNPQDFIKPFLIKFWNNVSFRKE